ALVGVNAATCSSESPAPTLPGSAGMPNCSCHLSSIQACGRPLTVDRMASSTRGACQSNQPIGVHWALGGVTRAASGSPCRAGFTNVFVFAVRTLATTVCNSMRRSFLLDVLGATGAWSTYRPIPGFPEISLDPLVP